MTQTRRRTAHPRSEGSTGRLQALADGVFAVAMTVLALSLPTGLGTGGPVTAVLRAGLPHLLLYFITMLALGALWFGHRNAFEYIRRTDHPHTWLSLAMLAFVPLVPWSVSLLARHVTDPLAVAVYNANLVMLTGLDAATWWYATRPDGLAERLPGKLTQVSRTLTLIPPCGFLLAIGLAWLSTWAALAVDVALPLLPITGASYRLQYRLSRSPGRSGP
jgi:TMEM175 potassium channel family protein